MDEARPISTAPTSSSPCKGTVRRDPTLEFCNDGGGDLFTTRGLSNLGCLIVLIVGLLGLLYVFSSFIAQTHAKYLNHSAGYPIISHFTKHDQSTLGGFNLGGINASGQVST